MIIFRRNNACTENMVHQHHTRDFTTPVVEYGAAKSKIRNLKQTRFVYDLKKQATKCMSKFLFS